METKEIESLLKYRDRYLKQLLGAKARGRAFQRLSENYPEEFKQLCVEELEKLRNGNG